MEELQSSAAPVPASQVRELLTQEWGASPDEVLHHLEQEPFAAASVAQVHRAVLLDGRDVVVKVQRPGAREQVKVDCDILLRFAAVAEQRFAWARQMGLADLARGLVGSLLEELDYRKEARHTEALAQALSGSADIVVPQVVAELSTGRVLVQSRLQGGSVAEGAERLGAEERGRLARELMTTTARSILVEGVFHADLHPGNIMLLDDGRLGLLDFGAIGVIDAETRQLLAALVSAVVADDNVTATAALLMAFPASGAVEVDRGRLQRELGRVMTFLAHTGQVDPATVSDLYGMLRDNGITVPGDVAGAVRTLTSLDGTLRALDPELGLMQAAREVVPALVADLASPRRNAQIAAHTALTAALVARRLPERVERVTDQLSRGELTVRTRPSASDRGWMRGVVDDVVTGALACVCLAMGLVFVLVPGGVRLTAVLTSHHLVAAGLVCVGVGLGMRFVVRVLGRRR
ncbi:MAG: AarF/ABC1/UbiB kinase family protein [Actinomyces urogenitalis]|uniref:ABC1 kinase family protein n=1 Tax=Actinomyces urogenitalis TaxID=103621 RepID=UPI002A823572|nr:AarF/ABC1/UbiB kinase family protein [Actinomyces urogenitalis]MDY3678681.1 AarF/ABC1/UbiB kinase family protein [Actinomyces urogenitalis]